MPAYVPGVPGMPKKVRKSKTLAKLRAGKAVKMCACGHYLPFFVHYAAESGYDCIWFDLEHRAMSDREVQSFLQMCYSFDIDCLVRSPSVAERTKLYRYLEDGATGVMIPLIKDAAGVESIVDAVKFPPIGNRGMDGAGVDAGFGSFEWPEGSTYLEDINRETFVCIQIERREALHNLEEICQVPGIDCFFFGPGDMGLRLSEAGGNVPSDPFFFPGADGGAASLDEGRAFVAKTVKKYGLPWGQPTGSPEAAAQLLTEGAQLLNLGGDFSLFQMLQENGAALEEVYSKAKM